SDLRRCGGRVPGQGPDRHRAAGRRAVLLAPGPAPVPRPGTPAVVAGHPAVPGTDPALDGDHAAAPSRLLRLLHRLPAFPALSRNRLQQSAPVLVLCAGGAGPDPAVVDPVVALVPAPGAAADGVRAARPPDRAGRPPRAAWPDAVLAGGGAGVLLDPGFQAGRLRDRRPAAAGLVHPGNLRAAGRVQRA